MATQRLPLARALERFEEGGPETDETVLQDVIGGAAFEIADGGLFIERPCDENERHVRPRPLRELEGFPAAEPGNVVVAENDVRCKPFQRGDEGGLRSHVLDVGRWRQARELTANQDGVALLVLDHEHANLFHATGLVMPRIVSVGGSEVRR